MSPGTLVNFKQCVPDSSCFYCESPCFDRRLYEANDYYGIFIRTEYAEQHDHVHAYVKMNGGSNATVDQYFIEKRVTATRVERMASV